MPNPLSTFGIKNKLSLKLSNPSFPIAEHNKELAAIGLEALVAWTRIEAQQFELFIEIIGGPADRAATAYLALESLSQKNAVVRALAEKELNEKELQLFNALRKRVQSCEKMRNRLAHWSWGYTVEIEDAFVLASPRQFVLENIDYTKALVYKDVDFYEIIDQCDQTVRYMRTFRGFLSSRPYDPVATQFHLLFEELGLEYTTNHQ